MHDYATRNIRKIEIVSPIISLIKNWTKNLARYPSDIFSSRGGKLAAPDSKEL